MGLVLFAIQTYQNIQKKFLEKATSGKVDTADIEDIFKEGFQESHKKQLPVKYEPLFTDWLYCYIHKTLDESFIVESQDQNLRDVCFDIAAEEVNEYADLVIRICRPGDKNGGGGQPVTLAVMSVEIPKVKETSTGMVAEMKLDSTGNVAIWEFYKNMSAIGTAILWSIEHEVS